MVDYSNLRLYLVVKNLIHNIDIRILESTLYITGYDAYCMALSVVWLGQAKWRGRPLQTVAADDCPCNRVRGRMELLGLTKSIHSYIGLSH